MTWPSLKEHKIFYFILFLSVILSFYTATFAHMNNWLIFKHSFFHLLEGTNLYQLYPDQHNDLFKYSPTFALFMAPLSYLPANLGATLWNLSGALLFCWAIYLMPLGWKQKKAAFWISLPEFIGSTQGFQSNIHIVALMFLFWQSMESEKPLKGQAFLVPSFLIKIFSILCYSLFLFRFYWKGRWAQLAKLGGISALTLILFLAIPVVVTGPEGLIDQYSNWLALLRQDASQSYGFSLMGVLHSFSGFAIPKLPIQMVAGLITIVVFFLSCHADQKGRLLGLISLCYFMVLFNHKSESPTFIIPMLAFGFHYSLISNKKLKKFLLLFTLGCVSLMYSDLFRSIKQSHLDVYCVKVWPFLILWPLALGQLLSGAKKSS